MTDYDYEDETAAVEETAPAAVPARRIRFDPTKERGADYFVRAQRHSRFVRLLRIGLPATALAAVLAFVAIVYVGPGGDSGPGAAAVVTLGTVNVESKSLVMEKPNISGFEGTRHAYEVTAAKAIQDLDNPKVFTLVDISAKVGVGADDTATIDANKGIYDSNSKALTLEDGITIVTTKGRKANFIDAAIDLEKGDLASDKALTISGAEGTITAKSIRVVDRGKRITFGGGVHLVINATEHDPFAPADPATAAAADKSPPADKAKGKGKAKAKPDATPVADAAPDAEAAAATAAVPVPAVPALPDAPAAAPSAEAAAPEPGTVPAGEAAPDSAPATAAVPPLPRTRPADSDT